jgi:arsenate reductase (glutaredoxin)
VRYVVAMTKRGLVFYGYDKCSTCRDAEKMLRARNLDFEKIALVDAPPTAASFRGWLKRAGLPNKRWVNVSGQSYRALLAERGKETVEALVNDPDELAELLATDGKLVKRPLLIGPETIVVGFDKEAYQALA